MGRLTWISGGGGAVLAWGGRRAQPAAGGTNSRKKRSQRALISLFTYFSVGQASRLRIVGRASGTLALRMLPPSPFRFAEDPEEDHVQNVARLLLRAGLLAREVVGEHGSVHQV